MPPAVFGGVVATDPLQSDLYRQVFLIPTVCYFNCSASLSFDLSIYTDDRSYSRRLSSAMKKLKNGTDPQKSRLNQDYFNIFRQPEAGQQHQPKEGSNTEDVKVESHTKDTHTKTSTDKTKKETEEHNEVWSNQVQFILTAVGLAVGLGNVWRFPYLAYAHGGAAFLIPYIFFGVTFGLPVLYIEFLMGQYSRSNPAKAFYRYAPAFQGVGLLTALLDFLIGAFYALVIAWAELYLVYIVMGQSWKWTTCGNWWNNESRLALRLNIFFSDCISTDSHNFCRQKNSSFPYAMANGTCTSAQPAKNIENGAQQFFGSVAFFFYDVLVSDGIYSWHRPESAHLERLTTP